MSITAILLPTRPQVDTLVGLFLLRQFGEAQYPGVSTATIIFNQQDVASKDWIAHESEGRLLVDMGGGPLDHHVQGDGVCLSQIVAKLFGQEKNKAITKLVELARRDDVDGQGTLSEDAIDRAFGLSGLVVSLNRVYHDNPNRVYELVTPLIEAHYKEQVKRTEELPKLFTTLLASGAAQKATAVHRGKKITIALYESDEPSLASYLRSFAGGNFDVLIQCKESGHVNILTHTNRRPDLRSLAVIVRKAELMLAGGGDGITAEQLSSPGRLDEVPQWYFDLATNSLQNGGVTPGKIPKTAIPKEKLINLVKIGLEETMWKPAS